MLPEVNDSPVRWVLVLLRLLILGTLGAWALVIEKFDYWPPAEPDPDLCCKA